MTPISEKVWGYFPLSSVGLAKKKFDRFLGVPICDLYVGSGNRLPSYDKEWRGGGKAARGFGNSQGSASGGALKAELLIQGLKGPIKTLLYTP